MKCWECELETEVIHHHHVVPQSRGGTKTVPLCEPCHSKAHHKEKNMTTSKLTREAIIKLRKEGRWPGRPPYGFKVVNGYLEKDDNWNHIIEAFKLRSQGARWAVVCDKLGRMSRRGARRLLERYGDIDGFIHFTNTNLRKASKE